MMAVWRKAGEAITESIDGRWEISPGWYEHGRTGLNTEDVHDCFAAVMQTKQTELLSWIVTGLHFGHKVDESKIAVYGERCGCVDSIWIGRKRKWKSWRFRQCIARHEKLGPAGNLNRISFCMSIWSPSFWICYTFIIVLMLVRREYNMGWESICKNRVDTSCDLQPSAFFMVRFIIMYTLCWMYFWNFRIHDVWKNSQISRRHTISKGLSDPSADAIVMYELHNREAIWNPRLEMCTFS